MKSIKPSSVNGIIKAPPSKSMTIRAAAAALLSSGTTEILFPSKCMDAQAAFAVIQDLGAALQPVSQGIQVKGALDLKKRSIQCGESGLCMRMFTPIAALLERELTLEGKGSLLKRPMDMMESPLRSLGVECRTQNGLPPVKVKGPLSAGTISMDGSLTSQFLSGLLMALPLCAGTSEIRIRNLTSKPYIHMTLELLRDFGIKVDNDPDLSVFQIPGSQKYGRNAYAVEGDWSGAAFLLAAGAISGKVTVTGLNMTSSQADRQILNALKKAGADMQREADKVTVVRSRLRPFVFDAAHCPDLIPALTALACFAPGVTQIMGAGRLVHKESDRAHALVSEFRKMGADLCFDGHKLLIRGGALKGGDVFSHNDHRIAMAEAAAGLQAEKGVRIRKWECVDKSYPDFFSDLISTGGRIK
jgi:3-phosphoshikimate 1-carboxyvinyltransferase